MGDIVAVFNGVVPTLRIEVSWICLLHCAVGVRVIFTIKINETREKYAICWACHEKSFQMLYFRQTTSSAVKYIKFIFPYKNAKTMKNTYLSPIEWRRKKQCNKPDALTKIVFPETTLKLNYEYNYHLPSHSITKSKQINKRKINVCIREQ